MEQKTRLTIALSTKIHDKLKKIKEETGVSVSQQIELKLSGYKIERENK